MPRLCWFRIGIRFPTGNTDYRLIRKAIREEEKLRLHYPDAEARTSDRTIRPIGLIYYVDNVLLASWCELREDYRHFRTDPILGCMPTGDRIINGRISKL